MNLACANKDCRAELKYLRGGRLFLMERKLHASPVSDLQANLMASREATPPRSPVALRRYFWLCESCAENYVIRRWTENGIELAPRHPRKHVQRGMPPHSRSSREWFMPGLVG